MPEPPDAQPLPRLNREHVEWLALIRYQAHQADEQSRQPLPLAAISLNGFQDAVEAVLCLIVEVHNITLSKKPDFHAQLNAVTSLLPALDSHRARLAALNTARVSFKHYGNTADQRVIERHRVNAMDFLVDAARLGLGQDFESVSMLPLIADSEARGYLQAASDEWQRGDRLRAAQGLRLAFDRLVDDYEQRKIVFPGQSLFTTEPLFMPSSLMEGRDRFSRYVVEWLSALDKRSKLQAFGIDLRDYAVLNAYAPKPHRPMPGPNGPAEPIFITAHNQPELTEREFDRCYSFVIDTALKLGSKDYDFDGPALRRQAESRTYRPTS